MVYTDNSNAASFFFIAAIFLCVRAHELNYIFSGDGASRNSSPFSLSRSQYYSVLSRSLNTSVELICFHAFLWLYITNKDGKGIDSTSIMQDFSKYLYIIVAASNSNEESFRQTFVKIFNKPFKFYFFWSFLNDIGFFFPKATCSTSNQRYFWRKKKSIMLLCRKNAVDVLPKFFSVS